MPLPSETERASAEIERIVAAFDAAVLLYALGKGRAPSVRSVLADIRPLLTAAYHAALSDSGYTPTRREVAAAVSSPYTAIERALTASLSGAKKARRDLPRVLPEQDEKESAAGFARRVGAIAAAAAIISKLAAKKQTVTEVLRVARNTAAKVPRPVSAYTKMVVRTEAAIERNKFAVDIAERDGLVLLIRDAMKGPTDRECEIVDGKYAEAEWLRRHPVEHPNCTRRGRPTKLPKGRHVTLLE